MHQGVGAVTAVAAGARHVLALLSDGRVIAWGDNASGQCNIPRTLLPAAKVFAGGDASAAIDRSGKLHAWGRIPPGVNGFTNGVGSGAIGSTTWLLLAR